MWFRKAVFCIVVCLLLWPRLSWSGGHYFDERLFPDVPGDCTIFAAKDTPLAEEQLALSWLVLEQDTEEGVLARFGETPLVPVEDIDRIYCYEDAESRAVALVSGFRGDISRVDLADSRQRLKKGTVCRRVPKGSFSTATQAGLRLGLRRAEVKALLGEPLGETPTRLYYGSVARIPMTARERELLSQGRPALRDEEASFDSVRTITVRLDKGRVYSFTLCKVTSY